MSNKPRVKVGIIGSQFQATCHAEAMGQVPDEAELVAIASPTPGHAENLAKKFDIPRFFTDYRQMLAEDDIEMVTITAPNHLHAQMTVDIANAGKTGTKTTTIAKKYREVLLHFFSNFLN